MGRRLHIHSDTAGQWHDTVHPFRIGPNAVAAHSVDRSESQCSAKCGIIASNG